MLRGNVVRGGILFVLMASATLSCGQRTPTEPDLPTTIVAGPTSEIYVGSPQQESRELLIDGRPTDIEWAVAGTPTVVLMRGQQGSGGDYFASVRALWSYNPFGGDSVALYLLVQWADPAPNVLEQPLVTSVDWQDDDGNSLVNCQSEDPLHQEQNWQRNTSLHEDQVEVEIYSDPTGAYPADRWRWGAGTTNPVTPVNSTEFTTQQPDSENWGENLHPSGGWAEDFYNSGSGWVSDIGRVTYAENFLPGSNIPRFLASKGSRDTRLNRGKPVSFVIWKYVAAPMQACDSLNPVRLEDAAHREKTWNPGDYVPSYLLGMPNSSQADVVARGTWEMGKWAVELRRLLQSREPDVGGIRQAYRGDDVHLYSGRTYGLRIRIYNASKTVSSQSNILSIYIKPRS